jgi:multiple sugar transport system substrate-binding protein
VTDFRSPANPYHFFLCSLVVTLFALVVAACDVFQPSGATETVAGTPSLTAPTLEDTPVPTDESARTPTGPVILRLWVPPQFDPASSTLAGTVFQSRLDQFMAIHPELKIEVRVKAVEGSGGLLDALSTAGAAAPLALPDVVALPRPLLEAAALKGLIHPFTDSASSLDDPDWYAYARELGRLQNSTFGLPFAGDALVLVYHPGLISPPPSDWASLLKTNGPLVFPAADPQALFTLALYLSAGGSVQDEQGRPTLDVKILSQVLSLYQEAGQTSLMPYTLAQYETDNQVWTAYQDQQAWMAITWASRYLENGASASASRASLLPTSDGTPFTLATGWMWTLASPQPDRQVIGAQLAEFLSASDFLAEWSLSIGYLPTRANSTAMWSVSTLQSLADQIGRAASPIPSTDVLASLGVPLSQAVLQVLKQQSDPLTAAQEAADYLKNP